MALAETVFHFGRFMAATGEEPATTAYRELIGRIDANLHDLRGAAAVAPVLDPGDYAAGQSLARELRSDHASNGVVHASVRYPAGQAVAVFWPDVAGIPVAGRHLCYRWNGHRADAWLAYGEEQWRRLP